jgi:hypothetical protein
MNNPPAFPRQVLRQAFTSDMLEAQDGMTLRDYFAAKALAGMWANGDWVTEVLRQTDKRTDKVTFDMVLAARAFLAADAMLEAREQ